MKQIKCILIFFVLLLMFSFKNDDLTTRDTVKNDSVLNLYRKFNKISTNDSVLNYLVQYRQRIDTLSVEEISVISLDIDSIKNAMRFEDYYKSGNSSSIINEYRVIKIKNTIKFIYSKFVGTSAFTNQDVFHIYDYDSINNKFNIDSVSENIFKINSKDYFQSNTPDSIISEFLTHSSNFYHLVYNLDGIAEKILVDELRFNNMRENKWILGNTIRYSVKNDSIVRSTPFFDE